MIHKLRARFILLAMLSMFFVLAVLIGGINVLNYNHVVRDADAALKELALNGGAFPLRDFRENDAVRRDEEMPLKLRGDNALGSRYFSVLFDAEGNVSGTDTKSIYSVDESTAQEMAHSILLSSSGTNGFVNSYRYLVSPENGGTRVIFYDCSRSLDNFRSFRNTSILISLLGMVLVFIMIVLLSGIITKPAAESYEKQKRFITDAGHEIKTPLAIINADTDVLETDVGEDNEWIRDIRKQIRNLTDLTTDLVLLSRMEETAKDIPAEDLDLSALIREIADSFRARALSSDKTYRCEIDDDIHIKGNKNSISHICSVLLDNAMKYSPDKGEVNVELANNGRFAVLRVKNTVNDPLTDEDINHLFDRFYRADSSRNSETGGHGLGLSIAKAETEMLKGKISAAKKDDSSLTVTVSLPL